MSMEQEYLRRIADQLERITKYLESGVPVESWLLPPATHSKPPAHTSSEAYTTAVARLTDMPDDIPADIPAEPVTKVEVVAALNACARKHGIEAGKRVLNSFAPRLDDVPAEKYAKLVATLEALG